MKGGELVQRRFQGQELTIRRLYGEDASFRSLWDDFCQAVDALHYWQSNRAAPVNRGEEYEVLVEELEDEISTILERKTNQ